MFTKDWIKVVYEYYGKSILNYAQNDFELHSWMSRGSAACQLMVALLDNNFRKISNSKYKLDNEYKGKLLLELCIATMTTLWYKNLDEQESHTGDEKTLARTSSFELVQHFLDISSSDNIYIYNGLDRQYQAYLNRKDHGLPAYYTSLFQYRYFECLSGSQFIHWRNIDFPVDEVEPILKAYCTNASSLIDGSKFPAQMMYIWKCITDSGAKMFETFKLNYTQSSK